MTPPTTATGCAPSRAGSTAAIAAIVSRESASVSVAVGVGGADVRRVRHTGYQLNRTVPSR